MYLLRVLSYLSWPFMIAVSYFLVRLAINYYEKKHNSEKEAASE